MRKNTLYFTKLCLLASTIYMGQAFTAPFFSQAQAQAQEQEQSAWSGNIKQDESSLQDNIRQGDYATDNIISVIEIKGNKRIEKQTIISYLGISAGDVADPYTIDRAMKDLFATGFFADIAIDYNRGNQSLTVTLLENPTVNQVIFEGNKALEDEDLKEIIQLTERSVFTRTKMQRDLEMLLERYRRAGRFSAKITPKIVTQEQNRIDLIYEINEGEVTYISDISFIGNKTFDTPTLHDVIKSQEECWYCFISDNDKYAPDRIQYDKELLRKFYTTQGYADFKVIDTLTEMAADGSSFHITFILNEGTKYKVGKVEFDSYLNKGIKEDKSLQKLVDIKAGELYNSESIESSIDAIIAEMGNRGFAFVDIEPMLRRHEKDKLIDIIFNIKEGPRVYVERINIKGNQRTLDEVIRREFRLVEGDPFSTSKLQRSEQRIKNLGFFGDVKVTRRQGSSPDRIIVDVEVEESSTGELSLGAGYSTTDGMLADIGIRERNLLGRGQDLRFKGMFATKRQQFDIGFTEPYFMDRELSVGFDLFKTTQDFSSEASFDRESAGGRLRAGYSISEHLKHSFRYSFEEVSIRDVKDTASLFIREQEGSNITSMIGHSLIYDKRNNKFDPSEGYYIRLGQDIAGLGGDSKFFRNELRGSYYYPLHPQWTIMLAGSVGHILGFDGEDVRINDRFFIGGRTLRGFDNAGIGPRDISTKDALGGNTYYTTTAEIMFPIGLPEELGFRGGIFVDAGSLFDFDGTTSSTIRDDASIRVSTGVGIMWKSPFGPIRVDFAKAVKKEDYDDTESFRLNFGTTF